MLINNETYYSEISKCNEVISLLRSYSDLS